MGGLDEKITELENRIDRLVRSQIGFQTEIAQLRDELKRLRQAAAGEAEGARAEEQRTGGPRYPAAWAKPHHEADTHSTRTVFPASNASQTPSPSVTPAVQEPAPGALSAFLSKYTASARADLEKFIGENLISKIGILVLIIGIGIGVKYSIDNDLISPLTRIILAYLFAFALVGLAIKLKPKYLNFSAALISGGMATMYFVTYFAYTTYALIQRYPAFGLMAMCTVFTVLAAIFYSRQVIAHIGLVGAYAVPFLLSTDSSDFFALFTYMAMINAGILAISIKKYWRPIFYTASFFTWLIFLGFFATRYSPERHFGLTLLFLGVFFGLFLATKLVHAIIHNERKAREAVIGGSASVFVFYVFCFSVAVGSLSFTQTRVFFAYLAVITSVLAAVALRFFGKAPVLLSFAGAWLVFAGWYVGSYSAETDFFLAATVSGALFLVFYAITLLYRVIGADLSPFETRFVVLIDSFVFYLFGYAILDSREETSGYVGLYTAGQAAFHLAVGRLIGTVRPEAVDVVQALTVLVLTFASIAIPVQLDGNQVTMAWSVEAALLFWFGRARGVRLFEAFAYAVMILATASLFFDWWVAFVDRELGSTPGQPPIANGNFVTAIVYIAAFAAIAAIGTERASSLTAGEKWHTAFRYLAGGLAILALYNALRIEIANYFHQELPGSAAGSGAGWIIRYKSAIWQMDYSLLFLAATAFINKYKVRSVPLAAANVVLAVLALCLLATVGMQLAYELRVAYMAGAGDHSLVSIRYISYLSAAVLLAGTYLFVRDDLVTHRIEPKTAALIFEAVAYTFWFVAASCELVNTMAQLSLPDATKLGLSIFWGVYALMLIVVGIAWNRKHLRVAAICLLAATLLKLFFYDVADLDTIPRTILFVSLGLTLLVISFLYNKYKNAIFGFAGDGEEGP